MNTSNPRPRLIAFYLPQFHPTPENDAWWGKGFTEWTNVVPAKPVFTGHYQPHLPADLGFYDLRLPEVRQAQADLAREHGVDGFCYYHYWFHGRRLLNRPFEEVLAARQPSLPFCLCWANEHWTRIWDGGDNKLLIEQTYSEADDLAHIRWLATAFRDPRYIRVDGKPLFLVYRAGKLPDPLRTTAVWRTEAMKLGIGELFLCRVQAIRERDDPVAIGFDAAVEFQPEFGYMATPLTASLTWRMNRRMWRRRGHKIYDYAEVVQRVLAKEPPPFLRFPCVTPMWDNTARRRHDATILTNSTPERYEEWLRTTILRSKSMHPKGGLVFVNAWNEWAEGNHLEPCQKWGDAYLKATRRAVEGSA